MSEVRTQASNAAGNVITNAFNKWADKLWFQILFVFIVIYLLSAPIITPIVTNYYQQVNTSEAVNKTLDDRDAAQIEAHRLAFERSKQSYALVKKTMQESLEKIECDYMFLLEYHNGSENVMTGIQFCKFDITIEVGEGVLDLVSKDKFRNENVAKYDILLSDALSQNRLLFYKKHEFEQIDKYLTLQLQYLNAESYAVVSLKDSDGQVFGTLLCVSKNDIMNTIEVLTTARSIEDIMRRNSVSNI